MKGTNGKRDWNPFRTWAAHKAENACKKPCDPGLQMPKEVDNMQTIRVGEGRHYANQMVYKGYDSWAQGL